MKIAVNHHAGTFSHTVKRLFMVDAILLQLATDIVAAHAGANATASSDLPRAIVLAHATLSELARPTVPVAEPLLSCARNRRKRHGEDPSPCLALFTAYPVFLNLATVVLFSFYKIDETEHACNVVTLLARGQDATIAR